MTELSVTSSPVDTSRFAGFWVRFLSVVLDMALYTPIYFIVNRFCGGERSWMAGTVNFVIAFALYVFCFTSKWQATPGMRLFKFHITDTENRRLSVSRAGYWLFTSTIGWMICMVGVIYLESRFDVDAVNQLAISCRLQNIDATDCQIEIEKVIGIPFEAYRNLAMGTAAIAVFLLLIWALSIGLSKDKTGFHNLLCRTRFLYGRL